MPGPNHAQKPLSLALGALDAEPPRRTMELAAGLGFRFVQLDAAAKGVRPRELGRSDRRALVALLTRLELRLSGVDLFIPPAHFTDTERAQRAFDALEQALALTAELASLGKRPLALSMLVPTNGAPHTPHTPHTPHDTRDAIAAAAVDAGVLVADLSVAHDGDGDTRGGGGGGGGGGAILPGLDPAPHILKGLDPAAEAARLADALLAARLTDADEHGRCAVGAGRLDVQSYAASLSLCGRVGCVVADARGVREPLGAAQAARNAWSAASTTM